MAPLPEFTVFPGESRFADPKPWRRWKTFKTCARESTPSVPDSIFAEQAFR